MNRVNDPIYGIISVNPIEDLVINSPLFLRLRDIKQLGMAYYIYPTATHNRFSHSLGVLYLVDKIFTTLQKKYRGKYEDFLNDTALKNLRMAALLHDIGHFPFSHAMEFTNSEYISLNPPEYFFENHEELTTYLIKNSYIKDILSKDDNYKMETICALIQGKDTTNLILNNLIHWELDADRLDYLLRDSYFTGVSFGVIDYNYLIESFEIREEEGIPFLIINYKAARSIENILNARYSLNDRVYTHEIVSYYDFLIKKIVLKFSNLFIPTYMTDERKFKNIILSEELNQFFEFSDTYIFRELCKKYNKLKSKRILSNDLKKAILDFESLLLRKKNDYIYRFPYVTKKDELDVSGRFDKINKKLHELDNNFNTEKADIYLNRPKNKFTSYRGVNYSIWDIDIDAAEEEREKEKTSIVISDKEGDLQSFFMWDGTYFKKIYKNKNYKTDIYISKINGDLCSKFEKEVKKEIKLLLKD